MMGLKRKRDQPTDRLEDPFVKVLRAGIERRFQAVLSDIISTWLCRCFSSVQIEIFRRREAAHETAGLTYVQEVSDENHEYRDPVPVSRKGLKDTRHRHQQMQTKMRMICTALRGQNEAASIVLLLFIVAH